MNKDIKKVLNILIKNNYSAYVVGGHVRDYLFHIKNYDVDIATNCKEDKLLELFKSYNPVNKGLITISFKINKYNFEITPLRIEDKYLDNRHPSVIKYTSSIRIDSNRRDLTINSLYMDINEKIYDYHNGINDLNNHLIKMIDNPDRRFKEDSLRILRCLRFSITYDFKIDSRTYNSMIKNKDLIYNLNPDKIKYELNKMLVSKNITKYLVEYKEIFNIFFHYEVPNSNIHSNNYLEVLALIKADINDLKKLNYSKKNINNITKNVKIS